MSELEQKYKTAVQSEQEASSLKLEQLKSEHEMLNEQRDEQFELRLQEEQLLLKVLQYSVS